MSTATKGHLDDTTERAITDLAVAVARQTRGDGTRAETRLATTKLRKRIGEVTLTPDEADHVLRGFVSGSDRLATRGFRKLEKCAGLRA